MSQHVHQGVTPNSQFIKLSIIALNVIIIIIIIIWFLKIIIIFSKPSWYLTPFPYPLTWA
jgi:hypothetical protein